MQIVQALTQLKRRLISSSPDPLPIKETLEAKAANNKPQTHFATAPFSGTQE
jgi:hypothetical protein